MQLSRKVASLSSILLTGRSLTILRGTLLPSRAWKTVALITPSTPSSTASITARRRRHTPSSSSITTGHNAAPFAFLKPRSRSSSTTTTTTMSSTTNPPNNNDDEDPYLYLEEVESEQSLHFAKTANAACLTALGDPTTSSTSSTYTRVLSILQSNDRIPYASSYGKNPAGDRVLMNLWKDDVNTKGLWRRTTMESYCGEGEEEAEWETVLDVDLLAAEDGVGWVWKGSSALPRRLDGDGGGGGGQVERTLVRLSRGGADAVCVREFDLLKGCFVDPDGEERGFVLPEAKTSVSYKSRDVLYVGSDFGEGSLTDSGYPRQIKEWARGTSLQDAAVVFEGQSTDVSVSAYVNDQRFRGGPIYDIRSRSITFYTRKRWVRRVHYAHLLPQQHPATDGLTQPEEFHLLDVQEDAHVSFVGQRIMINLRSDWTPIEGKATYKSGSLIYADADTFLDSGKDACHFRVLFEPTDKTALDDYTFTKNFVIISIMDNVKIKTLFYRIDGDEEITLVGGDDEAKIEKCSAGSIDSTEGDEIWWYSSGYTQPNTLSIGDASLVTDTNTHTDTDTGTPSYVKQQLKSLPAMYDTSGLVVTQKFATSEDGTQVPYFIIAKEGIELDGNTPTLLYGYGGFEISLGPKYIATVGAAWLERGGAFVEANIRGGGEFGPSWHQAGLKANRNKCFEDFIAVAEHLISQNICKPSTLAVRGGSNGGLLVGMMYVLRPDLFGAIHCAVPLLDMKRYHLLPAGASWMAEYGNPDTDWDDFLNKYSPYHLIDENVERYPPLLVTTSTRDDRVHPGHARKFVKKLWDIAGEDESKDWPVYYYENIEGGHGGAADSKQSAFMTALAYDFMWETLCKGRSS